MREKNTKTVAKGKMSNALNTRSSSRLEPKERAYIVRLPVPPLRRFGKWQIYDIEPKDEPDDDGDGLTNRMPPHPSLQGYWGNVDDRCYTYLFREPTLLNYQPVKLENNQIRFKYLYEVSHYLINYLHILIK